MTRRGTAGTPVLVDTDGGLDDVVALRALAATGRLWGVTSTWGNVSAPAAARNASLAVPTVPVWSGSKRPPPRWRPSAVHGHDGLGDSTTVAQRIYRPTLTPEPSEVMIEFARSEPSGVLLCIGPLTNLATALTRTAAVQQLRRLQIVVSGGVGVSRSPMDARIRDTNTRHDPQATASVIRSDLSIRWVGLDVSRRFILRRTDMTAGQIGGFAATRSYGLRRRPLGRGSGWSAPCHDLVAATAAVNPAAFAWTTSTMRIATRGSSAKVCGTTGHPGPWPDSDRSEAAVDVDLNAVRAMWKLAQLESRDCPSGDHEPLP
ncbi:nucleoside hydrolase [Gordonia sp. NPDC003504]